MIDLGLLTDAKQRIQFAKGSRIQPVGAIYIVVIGQIDIFDVTPSRNLVKVGSASPGMSIGQEAFFGLDDFQVYQAAMDVTVYAITHQNFNQITRSNPKLMYGLMENFYIPPKFVPQKELPKIKKKVQSEEVPKNTEAKKVATDLPKTTSDAPSVQTLSLFPAAHKSHPGITHPEYDKLLFTKEFKCPYCGKNFETKKPFASKLVADGPMRYDLRQDYKEFNHIWYDLLTCPHCYFTMFADTFTAKDKLHPRMIKDVMDHVQEQVTLSFDAERDLDFVFAAHYLAIPLAEGYSNNQQILMKLWANLSWLYEDLGETELEKQAAQKAAEASQKLYMESTHLSASQEQLVCLSIAGMQYRAGKIDGNVMKWLFTAKTNREGKPAYAELAERLMEDVKALEKQQAEQAEETKE